ncbi:hypothetical protein [Legionella clemsonensis]|uniref:Uncharacterized protein n=1 Tax=Legionella clemsonensis TaxID=1867846 RepID=A0A222P3E0_9GAMM|nr:hypothetical protein [Legionella clemsonensis]ASQ46359.1 hypothetical protein clem_09040 [Legionella clemsonensis]
MNFYKTNFRGDPVKKTCKDDQSLRVQPNSMFFSPHPGQKINDLIAKALDLISNLYIHSSSDEEMKIFCQQSYAALNHYQFKLEQGTLQKNEIERLIDFVKTLEHLDEGLEPSTVERMSSS